MNNNLLVYFISKMNNNLLVYFYFKYRLDLLVYFFSDSLSHGYTRNNLILKAKNNIKTTYDSILWRF